MRRGDAALFAPFPAARLENRLCPGSIYLSHSSSPFTLLFFLYFVLGQSRLFFSLSFLFTKELKIKAYIKYAG